MLLLREVAVAVFAHTGMVVGDRGVVTVGACTWGIKNKQDEMA